MANGENRQTLTTGQSRRAAALLALGTLAGCSAVVPSNQESGVASPTPAIQTVAVLQGTLNYDGLRADNLCQGGGARPCFAPIRTEPRFAPQGTNPSANYLNPGTFTVGDAGERYYTEVTWPYEGSSSRQADNFSIVCRVVGDTVSGYDTAKSSDVWDAVIIPAELAADGIARVGYMPERWVQLPPEQLITDCSEGENPAGAPVAATPTQDF